MNMARNVYEHGREGKCVYMFRQTLAYAGIIEVNIRWKKSLGIFTGLYALCNSLFFL